MAKILIAGGSGLVGKYLSRFLSRNGHQVVHLSRQIRPKAAFETYQWNIKQRTLDTSAFKNIDYVVNLAGAGIADKRWTKKRRKIIMDSRVKSTELLLKNINQLDEKPTAYIGASAIGIYGNRDSIPLKEDSPLGTSGFLPLVCQHWEQSILEIPTLDIRKIILRIGIVLTPKSGALAKMLLSLKFGIANYFGSGAQYYSWIHINDLCNIFLKTIEDETMQGTYNAVAPYPVTNKQLMQAILRQKKGILLPIPALFLRVAMGEMADIVLDSTNVSAEKIIGAGYNFKFPEIDGALEDLM